MENKLPILLIFFNRKVSVIKSLKSIASYMPSKIYLASDGPRDYIAGENELVEDIRRSIVKEIHWPCEIHTLYRKKNLGCKYAVHNALQWFFSNVDCGIVIEDDIVPTSNFYNFCEEALYKYKENKIIGSVSGRNGLCEYHDEIIFSSRFQCWGWASWSDRILNIDVEYGYKKKENYSILFHGRTSIQIKFINAALSLMQSGRVNSWAYPYDLHFKRSKQLHIFPAKNMITNIGFDTRGTHSSKVIKDIKVYTDHKQNCTTHKTYNENIKFTDKFILRDFGGYIGLWVMSNYNYFKYAEPFLRLYRKISLHFTKF